MYRRITHVTPQRSIITSSIKCTWVGKRISKNTTSLFKLKRVLCNPLKQTPCFIDIFTMKSFFLVFYFFKQNKILSQTYREKTQYSTPIPGNGAKKLIGPQAHGGIVAFQCRSHRDQLNYQVIIFQGLLSEQTLRFEI